jgi:hypothetical protein
MKVYNDSDRGRTVVILKDKEATLLATILDVINWAEANKYSEFAEELAIDLQSSPNTHSQSGSVTIEED